MKNRMMMSWMMLPLFAMGALEINFEGEEYRAGNRLWGQGPESARWQGSAEPLFSVVDGVGVEDSAAVRVTKRNREHDAALLRPDVSVHLPGFRPERSVVAYRLSVKMEGRGNDGICSRIRFADGTVQLELYNEGKLFFMDGNTPEQMHRSVRTESRAEFQATPGEFFEIIALVDYGSKTYTLTVNGVDQNGGNPVGMRITDETPGKAVDVWIAAWMQSHSDWQNFVFDNVGIRLVKP
ncbi:MAG: hypothetical protein JJU29_14845 [Verrucomicrobia bacterium]|nr:hypothetical protein [Verrucomicrobiota bacterium]MCH8510224.1 hypothetical protein [Kiritimatiellia bacterium]